MGEDMMRLWPSTAHVDGDGTLWVGGCSLAELAQRFGTPLYVFDELSLRENARLYLEALSAYKPAALAAYASKAYLCTAIAQIMQQEGLDLDVVSHGELYVALRAGFPPERIHFHGNNKSSEELRYALAVGVGRIVVDNFREMELLAGHAHDRTAPVSIWLRLAPGVQAHTHAHIQTGQEDTKFGFSIASGDAERAVVRALSETGLRLVGLHAHIGSQIYEPEALADAADRLIRFAAEMRDRHGFKLRELSPGGGWGVPMTESDPPAPVRPYVSTLIAAVESGCERHAMAMPKLVLEPGRSIVARAGVALYSVSARKEIPGIRTYLSVDGGMADNIRPALYDAKYHAARVPAGRPDEPLETVTIAGKYCESGDVLIREIALPPLRPGDLLAIPMAGAYTLSMSSNYNQSLRPAVIFLREGRAELIQRRERYTDLVARDLTWGSRVDGTDSVDGPRATPRPAPPRVELPIIKYQAHGNDYIVLDPLDWPVPPAADEIRRICDRNRGVGSDGLLYGPLSREPFAVRLFNPDGGEFEKSGNGLRIFARYLWDRGLPERRDFTIDTRGGLVTAHVLDDAGDRIAMDLGTISFDTIDAGVTGPARQMIEAPVNANGRTIRATVVSVGNPHCVVFPGAGECYPDEALIVLAKSLGPMLETLSLYRNGTNVQFARVEDKHTIFVAIWERGAGYTLASGTSSCAAAAAAIRTGRCRSPVTVRMPGGVMLVEIDPDWSVRLTGSVSPVLKGDWLAG